MSAFDSRSGLVTLPDVKYLDNRVGEKVDKARHDKLDCYRCCYRW